MNVIGLRGEQVWVNGMGETATLPEIEANRGPCRGRRHVHRLRAVRGGDVDGTAPERLRHASFAVGPRDVKKCEPRQERLKPRSNDCESGGLLGIKRTEKDATAR